VETFARVFHARGYELGHDSRVAHVAFLRWFEEAAIQASAARGFGLAEYDRLGAAWIMRDLDVEFLDTVGYGEPVVVTTWVSDFRRVQSHRDYEARGGTEDTLLARARAEWVFLDTAKMVPRRITPEMIERFRTVGRRALDPIDWPHVGTDNSLGEYQAVRRVQQHEIDQMHHVNNTVYLTWIEQQAREAWLSWGRDAGTLKLRRHYIRFLRPAQIDDVLQISCRAARIGSSLLWQHTILHDQVLCAQSHSLAAAPEW
jgi:acyl-CoA thioesterase FadM